jgi:hypothetical protein
MPVLFDEFWLLPDKQDMSTAAFFTRLPESQLLVRCWHLCQFDANARRDDCVCHNGSGIRNAPHPTQSADRMSSNVRLLRPTIISLLTEQSGKGRCSGG